MPTSGSSFLRQLSGRSEAWKPTSRRWHGGAGTNHHRYTSSVSSGASEKGLIQMGEEFTGYSGECGAGGSQRKTVMVVVDQSSHSKHAMMWALTHVADHGDLLTLLHVIKDPVSSPHLAASLASLCKACKPEVEVEALVIQGPKLETVLSQVKKLEVSVLVLGQKRPSPLFNCFCGSSGNNEEFVGDCINNAECMTIGVRRQSRGNGGYLISTRWQKNFWLLA